MIAILRHFSSFVGVGLVSAVVHYGVLIGLVEGLAYPPVPAALTGYIAGGVINYALNRRHTFMSKRPHEEAAWRFALVAGIGLVLTSVFMHLFVEIMYVPYLLAQIVTTGIIMLWNFNAHLFWTFGFGHYRISPIKENDRSDEVNN